MTFGTQKMLTKLGGFVRANRGHYMTTCTIQWKRKLPYVHLHCLIHPIWVPFTWICDEPPCGWKKLQQKYSPKWWVCCWWWWIHPMETKSLKNQLKTDANTMELDDSRLGWCTWRNKSKFNDLWLNPTPSAFSTHPNNPLGCPRKFVNG